MFAVKWISAFLIGFSEFSSDEDIVQYTSGRFMKDLLKTKRI